VDPLDWLIAQETVREILETLAPGQLVVAALRMEGLSNEQIADLLGITHQAVNSRMVKARRRLARELPELAVMIEGRRRYTWEQRGQNGGNGGGVELDGEL
jgi:DNA-directed RNA polymerase specialized sigma24 family protein